MVRDICVWYTDANGEERCIAVRGTLHAVDFEDDPKVGGSTVTASITTPAAFDPRRFGEIFQKVAQSRIVNTYACEEGCTYRLLRKPGKNARGKAHRMLWERVD